MKRTIGYAVALAAALTLLFVGQALAHPRPKLTEAQKAYVLEQVGAAFDLEGHPHKLRLRALAQGGGMTWVHLRIRFLPPEPPGAFDLYGVLDAEHRSTPCLVALYSRLSNTLVPFPVELPVACD